MKCLGARRVPSALLDDTDLNLILWGVFFSVADYVQHAANGYIEVMMIGSYHFYFNDLAVALLGIVVLRNLVRVRPVEPIAWCVLGFCIVAGIGLGRGLGVNPFEALISFRWIVTFPVFLIVFVVIKPPRVNLELFRMPMTVATWSLITIYIGRLLFGQFFLVRDPGVALDPESLNGRLLDANAAIFLGAAIMYFVQLWRTQPDEARKNLYALTIWSALIVELLSRQRTATVATFAGLAVYLMASPALLKKIPSSVKVLALIFVAGAIGVALLGASGALFDLLPKQYQASLEQANTFVARTVFWQAALTEFAKRDILDKIFGIYAGKPTLLILSLDQVWQTSLHNQGVQTLNNFGIAGAGCLALIVMFGMYAAIRAMRRRNTANAAGIPPELALSWLVSMVFFGIDYEWIGVGNLFVALACVPWKVSRGRKRAGRPSVSPVKAD